MFEGMGLEAIADPLLNIVIRSDSVEAPKKDTHLIFTSRNGVRAFADKHERRNFAISCVGDATAVLATSHGFTNVSSAKGAAADVTVHILKTVSKETPIRHCAGFQTRGRIVQTLIEAGYNAEHVWYYRALPVEAVSLELDRIDYVALSSPLGAQTFAHLLADQDLSKIKTLSISAATNAVLKELDLADRLIADRPNNDAMMARLKLDLETG